MQPSSASPKTVLLLVGPKGAGKTYIATVFSELYGLRFLRVDSIWQEMRAKHGDAASAAFRHEAWRRIGAMVALGLSEAPAVILDTTGVMEDFSGFLTALKTQGTLRLLKVACPPEVGLQRAKTRDAGQKMVASDAMIEAINRRSAALELPYDAVIDNGRFCSIADLRAAFQKLNIAGVSERRGLPAFTAGGPPAWLTGKS